MSCAAAPLAAQSTQSQPYEPTIGQPGKDSVWVPTPPELVERMLDIAKVTPEDVVIDLGSGDGRMVIAAAKRGARAIGVEWDENLVRLSKLAAEKAGVANKAEFVRHDMFTYDISNATVMALFMLPDQMRKLTPNFLALRPGSRIVINTFQIPQWEPDHTDRPRNKCAQWCTALLYYVPAKVEGTWRLGAGELVLKQQFQQISGTLTSGGNSTPVEGRLRGDEITFSAGEAKYTGKVSGGEMGGQVSGRASGQWTAVRK